MRKNKLNFIIGTSALVANLGFSSLLITGAQNAPGIEDPCPSAFFMTTPPAVNFYLSENENPPNTTAAHETAFSGSVFGSMELGVAICNPSSTVSIYIYGDDFINTTGSESIPIQDLKMINPKPFECKNAGTCATSTIPVNYTDGQNFPPGKGSESQMILMTYSVAIDYPTGPRPNGFYQTNLEFEMPIMTKPPGKYLNQFTITLIE